MEGWVKFFRLKNIVVVSEEKSFAVIPQTIEANGDQDSNINKMNNKTIKSSILLKQSDPSVPKP